MTTNIIAAQKSPAVIEYLLGRRSTPIKTMTAPGPSPAELETILKAAARVPDHGKLFPWYFVVIEGDARRQAGELLKKAWQAEEENVETAKLELEAERFMRAPLVIAVISRMREGKNPMWEQILSAGAACHNLCLAANALGYGANWVTEWYAFSKTFKTSFGLDERDNVAGFIYIGTPSEKPEERDRPDLAQIVTHWKPGVKLNKGENYGRVGMGLPPHKFTLPE